MISNPKERNGKKATERRETQFSHRDSSTFRVVSYLKHHAWHKLRWQKERVWKKEQRCLCCKYRYFLPQKVDGAAGNATIRCNFSTAGGTILMCGRCFIEPKLARQQKRPNLSLSKVEHPQNIQVGGGLSDCLDSGKNRWKEETNQETKSCRCALWHNPKGGLSMWNNCRSKTKKARKKTKNATGKKTIS